MKHRDKTKYVHQEKYVAEIHVVLMKDESNWSPHLSLEDAYKLDDMNDALRRGDLELGPKYGRIYELRPVAHR